MKEKFEFKLLNEVVDYIKLIDELNINIPNIHMAKKKKLDECILEYLDLLNYQNRIKNLEKRLEIIEKMLGKLDTIKVIIEILNSYTKIGKKKYEKIGRKYEIMERMQNGLINYIKKSIKEKEEREK